VLGRDIITLKRRDIPALRREMGIIFQDFKLLHEKSVRKNLEFVLKSTGWKDNKEINERIESVLTDVGMLDKIDKLPHELSGGEQQRVAIARALVNNPAVILADEATGNLDTRTSFEILVLFQKLHAEGRTIIFVTHNPDIARYSSRNIQLRDGRVISDEYNNNIQSAAEGLAVLPANSDE